MEEYAYKSFLYEQLGGGEKCKNAENALHNFSTHRRAYNKEEEEEEEKKLRAAEYQIGYNEGHNDGRNEGQKIKQNILINNYMSKKNVSLEEACDTLGVSLEEYHEAEKFLKNN